MIAPQLLGRLVRGRDQKFLLKIYLEFNKCTVLGKPPETDVETAFQTFSTPRNLTRKFGNVVVFSRPLFIHPLFLKDFFYL